MDAGHEPDRLNKLISLFYLQRLNAINTYFVLNIFIFIFMFVFDFIVIMLFVFVKCFECCFLCVGALVSAWLRSHVKVVAIVTGKPLDLGSV